MGDAGSFIPASKIFTSSPALNINTSDKKTRTHHRRGSSGDKVRTQLSMELKNEIDSKVNKRGWVIFFFSLSRSLYLYRSYLVLVL